MGCKCGVRVKASRSRCPHTPFFGRSEADLQHPLAKPTTNAPWSEDRYARSAPVKALEPRISDFVRTTGLVPESRGRDRSGLLRDDRAALERRHHHIWGWCIAAAFKQHPAFESA